MAALERVGVCVPRPARPPRPAFPSSVDAEAQARTSEPLHGRDFHSSEAAGDSLSPVQEWITAHTILLWPSPRELDPDAGVLGVESIAGGLDSWPRHFPNRRQGLGFLRVPGWLCHCQGHESSDSD